MHARTLVAFSYSGLKVFSYNGVVGQRKFDCYYYNFINRKTKAYICI